MKAKYLIIYLSVGAAFLAVSLLAFLSGGRSARLVRAKYVLGGIMLTAWTMLSAASCGGFPPQVTCYEPVVTCYDVPAQMDMVTVSVKDKEGNSIKAGEILLIGIKGYKYESYSVTIAGEGKDAQLIQAESFKNQPQDEVDFTYELALSSTSFKGAATVSVFGDSKDGDGNEQKTLIGTAGIVIL